MRTFIPAVILVTILSIDASAQTISFGAKVGGPLNDSFIPDPSAFSTNPFTTFTKRYTVGPSIELMSPLHIGFEANALYKRSGYTRDFNFLTAETKVNSWEFPLLFKARIPGESVGAFADAGLSLRRVQGTTTYSDGTQSLDRPLELAQPWTHGFVAGGGVSLKFGSIHFDPELRYTRWGTQNFSAPGAFVSNPNQIEYLLGIRF
jgi:hypothetical protein